MATYTKLPLSGSDNGRNIVVGVTATPGTTIHTATSSTGAQGMDEIYIWAGSTHTATVNLGITFGGGNNVQDQISVRIPAEYNGPVLVVPGLVLQNGYVVTATASVGFKVNLSGFVNRISLQSS